MYILFDNGVLFYNGTDVPASGYTKAIRCIAVNAYVSVQGSLTDYGTNSDIECTRLALSVMEQVSFIGMDAQVYEGGVLMFEGYLQGIEEVSNSRNSGVILYFNSEEVRKSNLRRLADVTDTFSNNVVLPLGFGADLGSYLYPIDRDRLLWAWLDHPATVKEIYDDDFAQVFDWENLTHIDKNGRSIACVRFSTQPKAAIGLWGIGDGLLPNGTVGEILREAHVRLLKKDPGRIFAPGQVSGVINDDNRSIQNIFRDLVFGAGYFYSPLCRNYVMRYGTTSNYVSSDRMREIKNEHEIPYDTLTVYYGRNRNEPKGSLTVQNVSARNKMRAAGFKDAITVEKTAEWCPTARDAWELAKNLLRSSHRIRISNQVNAPISVRIGDYVNGNQVIALEVSGNTAQANVRVATTSEEIFIVTASSEQFDPVADVQTLTPIAESYRMRIQSNGEVLAGAAVTVNSSFVFYTDSMGVISIPPNALKSGENIAVARKTGFATQTFKWSL